MRAIGGIVFLYLFIRYIEKDCWWKAVGCLILSVGLFFWQTMVWWSMLGLFFG